MVFLFRTFPILLLLLSSALPALADTPVIFRTGGQDLRTRQIESFLVASGILPTGKDLETAKTDLNNDGIDETIFRHAPERCTSNSSCLYVLGGLSARQPVHIATFHARKIGISSENAYGVKKILVYNQKQNDFQYITYVWNPLTSAFEGP